MKTVILCGGKGIRYKDTVPKALSMIGNIPIIHHIMNIYSIQGFDDFILTLGSNGDQIIEYFKNIEHHYNIEFINTGIDTHTGGRIKAIQSLIPKEDENFFCTYADGLSNVNLDYLLLQHIKSKKIATITVVNPYLPFGLVKFDDEKVVIKFSEKPKIYEFVNGGFFIFNKKIFDYINTNDILEKDVFIELVKHNEISIREHLGFWDTINSIKDEVRLNDECSNLNIGNILPWMNIYRL